MLNINTILGLYEYTWGIMKKNSLKKYLLITTTLLFILNVNIIQSQAYMGNETSSYNQESIEKKEFKVYFVIGIGIYFPYQGTWPAIHEISPILLFKIGFSECKILRMYSSGIDFIEGDKFIGYYPFLKAPFLVFPLNIGFVCGIWLDKQ